MPRKDPDELRLYIGLRHATDGAINDSLIELVDYIEGLEKRIKTLEEGAQNKPFVLPKRDTPGSGVNSLF